MLSYSSSVMGANTSAGSSTRTPMSTRLDLVGIFRSSHTVSIHLLPLRPTEMMHLRPTKAPLSVSASYRPSAVMVRAFTGVRKWNSTLSFSWA